MIDRQAVLTVGVLVGLVLALSLSGSPQLPGIAFSSGSSSQEAKAATGRDPGGEDQQGLVKLSAEAIEAAGIDVAAVQSGTIARRLIVPGTIVPQADRIAHVAVKLSGIVAELRKKIG